MGLCYDGGEWEEWDALSTQIEEKEENGHDIWIMEQKSTIRWTPFSLSCSSFITCPSREWENRTLHIGILVSLSQGSVLEGLSISEGSQWNGAAHDDGLRVYEHVREQLSGWQSLPIPESRCVVHRWTVVSSECFSNEWGIGIEETAHSRLPRIDWEWHPVHFLLRKSSVCWVQAKGALEDPVHSGCVILWVQGVVCGFGCDSVEESIPRVGELWGLRFDCSGGPVEPMHWVLLSAIQWEIDRGYEGCKGLGVQPWLSRSSGSESSREGTERVDPVASSGCFSEWTGVLQQVSVLLGSEG